MTGDAQNEDETAEINIDKVSWSIGGNLSCPLGLCKKESVVHLLSLCSCLCF